MMAQIGEMSKDSGKPVLGITGTGGSGKSSLIDEIVTRFLGDFPGKNIGIIHLKLVELGIVHVITKL